MTAHVILVQVGHVHDASIVLEDGTQVAVDVVLHQVVTEGADERLPHILGERHFSRSYSVQTRMVKPELRLSR